MNKLKLFNYDLGTGIARHCKLSTVENSIICGVMPHSLLEINKELLITTEIINMISVTTAL
jgi:hypothetical protein